MHIYSCALSNGARPHWPRRFVVDILNGGAFLVTAKGADAAQCWLNFGYFRSLAFGSTIQAQHGPDRVKEGVLIKEW
jgi:hypothetical protein